MKFNEILKQTRNNAKMTQMELAEKCGVAQGTIANWERGARLPDIDMLKTISVALDVPIESLFSVKHEEKHLLLQEQKKETPIVSKYDERWENIRKQAEKLPDETIDTLLNLLTALIETLRDQNQ